MTGINFNELWQSQAAAHSNPEEIIAKAENLQKSVRRKIVLGNLLLGATLVVIIGIVAFYKPAMLTSKIGTLLVIIGIVMQIVASGKMIPLVGKNNAATTSTDYLRQMLQIRKKQSFLQTTIMSLYFILLTVGIFLYMYEYTLRMQTSGMVLAYGITGLWFAFAWFYLRPKAIKKQQQQLNELIGNLEKMNRQMDEDSIL